MRQNRDAREKFCYIFGMQPNPILQFEIWFKKANACKEIKLPDAACLSTIDPDGYPEGRIVLVRDFDERGFVFYTNRQSTKGKSLHLTPRASLTFFWEPLLYQVRIQGDVEVADDDQSDDYFKKRPRDSRIAAWASNQSKVLTDRSLLESKVDALEAKFKGKDVPRPPHWGGYRVVPRKIEFWIDRAHRLHDRYLYTKSKNGAWTMRRLYP